MIIAKSVHRTHGTTDAAVPVYALRGVDLEIPIGSVTAVFGGSGSGKTSLLKCLGSLEKPDHGEVTAFGTTLTNLDPEAAARWRKTHLGFLDQSQGLLPWLSARQNVEAPLQTAGVYRVDRRKLAADALDRVGLADWVAHLPDELSGGQRLRVALARSIANDPPLLLADEPTASLDEADATLVLKLLRGFAESGTTVVVATQDERTATMADHKIELRDGTAHHYRSRANH